MSDIRKWIVVRSIEDLNTSEGVTLYDFPGDAQKRATDAVKGDGVQREVWEVAYCGVARQGSVVYDSYPNVPTEFATVNCAAQG